MKKEDTNIHVRVSQELKDKFLEACAKNEKGYSDVIRNLMRSYIRGNVNE